MFRDWPGIVNELISGFVLTGSLLQNSTCARCTLSSQAALGRRAMLSQHPEQLNHNQAGPLVSPAADEIVILSEFLQRRWCCLTAVLRSTRSVLVLRLLKIQNMFAQKSLLSTNIPWVSSRSPAVASLSRAHLPWDSHPSPAVLVHATVHDQCEGWEENGYLRHRNLQSCCVLAFGTNPKHSELWLGGAPF